MNRLGYIHKIFIREANDEAIRTKIIKLLCLFIVLLFKPENWYSASFRFYKLLKYVRFFERRTGDSYEVKRVRFFNRIMSYLTRTRVPFYIPYHFDSPEIISENGILFCSSHLPLAKVGMKAMIENNQFIDAAIAKTPSKEMTIAIWGRKESLPALKADFSVLLKAKSMFQKKSSIYLMIDDPSANTYSPNGLKICQMTNSTLVFSFVCLRKTGVIDTWLELAPFPHCKNDEEINANIDYLKCKSQEIHDLYTNRLN